MRFFRITLVLTSILALLFPLLGLAYLITFPPPDPWGQTIPSFWEMLQEEKLQKRTINSLILSIAVALGATALGGSLAWMEHRHRYFADRWLHILSLLPLAIPSYLIAASLSRSMETGILSALAFQNRFVPAWFSLVVVTAPYVQLACGAALRNSSASEEEAALLLSANWYQRFSVSTWPSIRSSVVFSMLISFLYAISDFGAVATLNLEVLTWSLFQSIRLADLHSAALMGVVLLVLTMPVLLFAHTTIGRKNTKKVSNPRPVSKKPIQKELLIPVYAMHAVVIGGGVVLPIYSMCSWVWQGWMRGLEFAALSSALWGTVWISALGAMCTVCLALAPAWESVRSRYGEKVPLLIYTASALPGVLLAFALMQSTLLITKHTGGYAILLSSGFLLFVGYALRFLAEGFGPLYNSIEQLDKRHEESATLLGATPRKWFAKVSFPIIRPSIIVSFLLVWLAIIKELPVTLILGSAIGGKTLAFHIWDRYEEALWHDAGLGGLVLITLALICFGFTLRWRTHV